MKIENKFAEIYRACNHGDNRTKLEKIKSGEVAVPRYIDIELTNFCNFHCRFCPTGTNSLQRTRGYMSQKVVESLITNVAQYHIPLVRFVRWGEPTLHSEYITIAKELKSVGAAVHINTNGSRLNDEQMSKLLDIKLDSIKFSFQGADAQSYNEMRHGGNYEKLLDILREFWKLRGDKPYPYIQVSTTLTDENPKQLERFKADIEKYCDYYNIGFTKLTHLNADSMQINGEEKDKIKCLQHKEKISHNYRKVCNEAFDKLSINWNGDVTLCCADYDNFMIVGNILDNDIKQIFNSRIANLYRNIIVKNDHGSIKCCKSCYEPIPLTE